MHEPITLTLRDKDNNPIETISTTFQPADLDLLNQFVSATLRVRESRLLTRGLPAITSINCSLESGMQITCAPYDNSELFELLHVLRPLILSREVASFDKSIAILGRRFSNKRLSRHLRAIRRVFEDGELKAYMQITVGDQPVFDDSLLKTWLTIIARVAPPYDEM